jgi:hypothetical protein
MKLRPVHEDCSPRICPTLYLDDDDPESVVVQADVLDPEGTGATLSPGEGLLRVPLRLLREGLPKIEERLR